MRLFVLFALTLGGIAATADDASAIGRRKRGNNNACCTTAAVGYGYGYGGMGYGGYTQSGSSCCGQVGYGGMGYGHGGYLHGGIGQVGYAPGYSFGAGACCGATGPMMMPGGAYPAGRPDVLPAGGLGTPGSGTGTGTGTGTGGTLPQPMGGTNK